MCDHAGGANLALPLSDRAPAAARRFLRDFLYRTHNTGVADDAALLTSEIVTNAVRHGAMPIHLTLTSADGRLRVSVSDTSAAGPVRDHRGELDSGGRGIPLLDAVADSWGVDRRPGDGKDVWFTLHG